MCRAYTFKLTLAQLKFTRVRSYVHSGTQTETAWFLAHLLSLLVKRRGTLNYWETRSVKYFLDKVKKTTIIGFKTIDCKKIGEESNFIPT